VAWYLKLATPSGLSSFSVSSTTRICGLINETGSSLWNGVLLAVVRH
jgi:hypothetical protein